MKNFIAYTILSTYFVLMRLYHMSVKYVLALTRCTTVMKVCANPIIRFMYAYGCSTIDLMRDIRGFGSKEKLASYAPVTGQNQSGSSDIRGHITKHGSYMLRFILVNAAHSVIKYSTRMKKKYLSLVRRLGRNRAIVAIARTLIEIIYTMLSRGTEFIDRIDALTERKMVAMRSRAVRPSKARAIEDLMNDLMNVRNERQKRIGTEVVCCSIQ